MREHFAWAVISVCALGCGSDGDEPTNEGAAGAAGAGGAPPVVSLAAGLQISEVAAYQALKVSLMTDGTAVEPRALPIVRGRDMLLRVFMKTEAAWTPRDVVARLEVVDGKKTYEPQEITRKVEADSVEDDMFSTFAFDVPGEQVTEKATWAVSIWETEAGTAFEGSTESAKFPAEGGQGFDAASSGEALKIVIVPYQYEADGSGRLPDTSETQLQRIHDALLKLYPVPEVELTVHEPLPWNYAIKNTGQGWNNVLINLLSRRANENPGTNVYYYGMFLPNDTFYGYCTSGGNYGCVLGLSNLARDPEDDWARGSVGIGYTGSGSTLYAADTCAHEIGHAHGREHAPCMVQDADSDFPHDGGRIGVWGYDRFAHDLIDPDGDMRDFMGYCSPVWISDYTYDALFQRAAALSQLAGAYVLEPAVPARYRTVNRDIDGSVSFGPVVELRRRPAGKPMLVELTDSHGRATGTIDGWYYPTSHLSAGTLLVEDQKVGTRSIRAFGTLVRP